MAHFIKENPRYLYNTLKSERPLLNKTEETNAGPGGSLVRTFYYDLYNEDALYSQGVNRATFDQVFSYMNLLARPLFGDFVESLDDAAFLEVESRFFEYLFWHNRLWVLYVSKSKQAEYTDFQKQMEEAKEDVLADDSSVERMETIASDVYDFTDFEDRCYIFNREENDDYNKKYPKSKYKYKWLNLMSGYYHYFENDVRLLCVDWQDGDERFNHWFDCAREHMFLRKTYLSQLALCSKVFSRSANNSLQREESEKLVDGTPVIDMVDADESKYIGEVVELMKPGLLKERFECLYLVHDRMLGELGRVANYNEKGERLTTGENYKDIYAIWCRKRWFLNQLKDFQKRAKKEWEWELKFTCSGVPSLTGMEQDNEGQVLPGQMDYKYTSTKGEVNREKAEKEKM